MANDQDCEMKAGTGETTALLPQVETMIQRCEEAVTQANNQGDLSGAMRAAKELRAYLELKYRVLLSEGRQLPGLHKVPREQNSQVSSGMAEEDPYKVLEVTALRIQIKLACNALGEPPTITEPTNLEYLKKRDAALRSRLEQRELLELSAGLGAIPMCSDERVQS